MKIIFYRTFYEKITAAILLSLFIIVTILILFRSYIEFMQLTISYYDFVFIWMIFLAFLFFVFYLFWYRYFILKGCLELDENYIKIGKYLKIKYDDVVSWVYNKGDRLGKNIAILTIFYKYKKIKSVSFYIDLNKVDFRLFKDFMSEKGIKYGYPSKKFSALKNYRKKGGDIYV